MAEYLVKVANERGLVSEQVERAESAEEVRQRLTQQGFLVYSLKPRGVLGEGGLRMPSRRKLKADQFVVFNQQFVTLIKAGMPILTALDLLKRRQRSPYFRGLLEDVHRRVKGGELLSEAFAAQGVLPKLYTTTLLAGEKSGNLEEVINRYISFQRVALSFRKKLLASLIYPALLVILVVIMLAFLVTYVVPRFAELYAGLEAQLPPLTTFILEVGVATQEYFLVLLGAAILAFALLWKWRRSPRGAQQVEKLQLRLPIFGDVWLKYQIAMFSRMLATLLAGGLPLVPALETAGGSMQSRLVAKAVTQATARVREGHSLSASLEDTGVFPDLAVEMIEVGESTGALPSMLSSVAEFYEEDVQTALSAAMSLIEPIILIGMGLVVATVLLSLYLPIFSLGSAAVAH